jgi:diguanylate cyclase (GGDEF)-like protein/putative nucleotidyltransferase with HDIG domain
MPFRELPRYLRVYILAHLLVLVPLMQALLRPERHDLYLLGGLLLFAVIFSTWKVELTIFQAKMTPTFAVVCLALLLQGVQAAVLISAVGAIVGTLARPESGGWKISLLRPPVYRVLFNVANCVLACLLSERAAMDVAHLAGRGGEVVPSLFAFTAGYFVINTLGIALAIAFQQGLPWFPAWKQNFLWTAPGYFASASAAAGIQAGYHRLGIGSLLFLAPLYLVYYSYRLYMERLHLYSHKLQQDKIHIEELNKLNQAVIASLATAIDAKDRYTCSHINRVQQYAVALARAAGMSGPELEAVSTGALVHDIGKLGVPDHILGKPGKLTPEEFRRIQSHVTIGTEILAPIPFPFPVVDVVRSHHERWDGLGYPDGLRGEDIPLGGRIIAIVDVFDALTSDRPYRRAMSRAEALQVLRESAGKQFDPRLVELFETVLPQVCAQMAQSEATADDRPPTSVGAGRTQSGLPDAGAVGGGRPTVGSQSAASRRSAVVNLSAGTPHSALEQISQAAAEMAAVCDVAHSLAEQETLDQVSSVVVDRALALLPADTAVLYLKGPTGMDLIAVAVGGKYSEKLRGMTIEMGEGVAGWVATNQQPRVNVSAALDIARRFTPEETMELSAVSAVPLFHGPEELGVLAVYTEAYSVLTGHHLHVLNILAEHAASAIQNLRRLERQRELAYTDALTGLANSRHLVRHLERLSSLPTRTEGQAGSLPSMHRSEPSREFSTPTPAGAESRELSLPCGPPFSIVMLDLDRFKDVNDRLGHLHGDELLCRVAQTLASMARAGDIICRYAGDEFVLLLPGANREHAEQVARRVRDAVDAMPPVQGRVKIGTSVGVASYPHDGLDGRTLLHAADQRMYEDKFQRRGHAPADELSYLPAGAAARAG